MLTTVRRSRPKGPLRAVPGATDNRKIGGRLCYCDNEVEQAQSDPATAQAFVRSMVSVLARCLAYTYDFDIAL